MEIFLRTFSVYLFLLLILRAAGKRTLSEMTTFDFVLLLIISEATQNALIGEDYSVTNGLAVILTLVTLDRLVAIAKSKYKTFEKLTEGAPLVLVDHGKMLTHCMEKVRVTESDILQQARQSQGLARLDQIKYAVLESSGGISIIPMEDPPDQSLERRIEAALDRVLQKRGNGL